jgi:hypothetical protein
MRNPRTMTTGRASLGALGADLRRHCVFAPVRDQVQSRQNTVRYRPLDTRLDALRGLRCGAQPSAQNHLTIRTDRAVQRACGRPGCAEPSTRARPLRACTAANVTPLERVSWYALQRSGAPPRGWGWRSSSPPCPLGPEPRAVRAPGGGVIAGRRDGKRSGCQRVPPAHSSLQRGSAGQRRLSRHAPARSRRWKAALGGRGNGRPSWSGAWRGALARPRCATGGAGAGSRASPSSATRAGGRRGASTAGRGRRRPGRAAPWPRCSAPIAAVGRPDRG